MTKKYCFISDIDRNIGFSENRQFFAESWSKSPKLVIITLAPSWDLEQNDFDLELAIE
jgi:hypothetical protein